jgi:hypothetical protein
MHTYLWYAISLVLILATATTLLADQPMQDRHGSPAAAASVTAPELATLVLLGVGMATWTVVRYKRRPVPVRR